MRLGKIAAPTSLARVCGSSIHLSEQRQFCCNTKPPGRCRLLLFTSSKMQGRLRPHTQHLEGCTEPQHTDPGPAQVLSAMAWPHTGTQHPVAGQGHAP